MLDGAAQARALLRVAELRELLRVREPHDRVPGRHAGVERRAAIEVDRAIERVVAQQREDGGAAARRLLEELLRALPAGTRHVHLVAPAEALDHDRQPARLTELDEELLVLGV